MIAMASSESFDEIVLNTATATSLSRVERWEVNCTIYEIKILKKAQINSDSSTLVCWLTPHEVNNKTNKTQASRFKGEMKEILMMLGVKERMKGKGTWCYKVSRVGLFPDSIYMYLPPPPQLEQGLR